MNIDNNNYKKFTAFILVLVAISTLIMYIISAFCEKHGIKIAWYIETPSIPSIYALLFLSFDKFFWKFKIFKNWGIIIADDLNGKWKGKVKSSHDNFKNETSVELDITQSATKIKICGVFNESKSVSIHENFGHSEVDNQTALYYFFRNEPRYDAVETMAIHEGAVKLLYNPKEKTLSGYYFSGRDRNNHGTIEVTKVE